LTKYVSLRRFLDWASERQLEMLDYEIAQLYTDELLDVYLGYKRVWKDIHNLIEEVDEEGTTLTKSAADELRPAFWTKDSQNPPLRSFEPSFEGLDQALQICRSLMVYIVKEVEDLRRDPKQARDKKRLVPYIRPQVFRTLLPISGPALETTDPSKDFIARHIQYGKQTFIGLKSGQLTRFRRFQSEFDNLPQILLGLQVIDLRIGPQDGVELKAVGATHKSFTLKMDVDPLPKDFSGTGQVFKATIGYLAFRSNSPRILTSEIIRTGHMGAMIEKVPVRFPPTKSWSNDDADHPRSTIILVWLTGWRFHTQLPVTGQALQVGMSGEVQDITEDGFTWMSNNEHADSTYSELRVNTSLFARWSWLAFPSDLSRIDGGMVKWANNRGPPTGRVTFRNRRGGLFTAGKPPRVWTALSGFDYTGADVLRMQIVVTDVTDVGFTWTVNKWVEEGVIVIADFAWLAFEGDGAVSEDKFPVDAWS
jgi:H-type lectin domain